MVEKNSYVDMLLAGELPGPLKILLAKDDKLPASELQRIEYAFQNILDPMIKLQTLEILTLRIKNGLDSLTLEKESLIVDMFLCFPESNDRSKVQTFEQAKRLALNFFIEFQPQAKNVKEQLFSFISQEPVAIKIAAIKALNQWGENHYDFTTVEFLDQMLREPNNEVIFAVLQLLELSQGLRKDNWFLKHDQLLERADSAIRGLYYQQVRGLDIKSDRIKNYEGSEKMESDEQSALLKKISSSVFDTVALVWGR